jgi:hypothetical protein
MAVQKQRIKQSKNNNEETKQIVSVIVFSSLEVSSNLSNMFV